MAHKKKHKNHVPTGNQAKDGPGASDLPNQTDQTPPEGAPFHDQDPKRRLGNFEGEGEHSIQQPGGKNDANH